MSSTGSYWSKPQPAAVLKHELLGRYVYVFASKTGSRSQGLVSVVDGYAGRGRYDDGTLGSPGVLLNVREKLLILPRDLRVFMCEQDIENYEPLTQYVDERDPDGLGSRVLIGTFEQHIATITAQAGNEPLLWFIDPYGVGVPFKTMVTEVFGRTRQGFPKTEVLLNFSVQAIDRIGGLINSGAKGREAGLATLDRTLGGEWWQPLWSDKNKRIEAIAQGYIDRLVAAAGGGWTGWVVPVADKIGKRPEYLLIHFTQHDDGRWVFYEQVTFATEAWRRACYELEPSGESDQLCFEGLASPLPFHDDVEAWIDEIERGARQLLAKGRSVQVQAVLPELCGRALGSARERHIRQALRRLHAEGLLLSPPDGKLQRYVIAPQKS